MVRKSTASPVLAGLAQLDGLRREGGAWLDRVGLGQETTPAQVLADFPGVRVLAYSGASREGPVLAVVPAPIKRAYIWDLAPAVSVIRRCLDAGVRVHLLEWIDPVGEVQGYGLEEYAHHLVAAALDAIGAATGEKRVFVAGHSLGGTMAALFAAREPDRLAGLILVEAPLRFGTEAGALAPLVATVPPSVIAALGRGIVPGSLLAFASVAASPDTFLGERWLDRALSLGNPATSDIHLRVERWTLDEFPMPGPLFVDIVEKLYRDDLFTHGMIELFGRRIGLASLIVPILAIVDPRSRIIPLVSAWEPLKVVPSADVTLLPYEGDVGVGLQHVGVLVGRRAHAVLWPEVLAWIAAHAS